MWYAYALKKFDPSESLYYQVNKEKPVYYFGPLSQFLSNYVSKDMQQKMRIFPNKEQDINVAILHSNIFNEIVDSDTDAEITSNILDDDNIDYISRLLGIPAETLKTTDKIILIRGSQTGIFNALVLIHEASHIYEEIDSPAYANVIGAEQTKTYFNNVPEINAHFNEMLYFMHNHPNATFYDYHNYLYRETLTPELLRQMYNTMSSDPDVLAWIERIIRLKNIWDAAKQHDFWSWSRSSKDSIIQDVLQKQKDIPTYEDSKYFGNAIDEIINE